MAFNSRPRGPAAFGINTFAVTNNHHPTMLQNSRTASSGLNNFNGAMSMGSHPVNGSQEFVFEPRPNYRDFSLQYMQHGQQSQQRELKQNNKHGDNRSKRNGGYVSSSNHIGGAHKQVRPQQMTEWVSFDNRDKRRKSPSKGDTKSMGYHENPTMMHMYKSHLSSKGTSRLNSDNSQPWKLNQYERQRMAAEDNDHCKEQESRSKKHHTRSRKNLEYSGGSHDRKREKSSERDLDGHRQRTKHHEKEFHSLAYFDGNDFDTTQEPPILTSERKKREDSRDSRGRKEERRSGNTNKSRSKSRHNSGDKEIIRRQEGNTRGRETDGQPYFFPNRHGFEEFR